MASSQEMNTLTTEVSGIMIGVGEDAKEFKLQIDKELAIDMYEIEQLEWDSTFESPSVRATTQFGVHYQWCPWSDEKTRCGPDTCACGSAKIDRRDIDWYAQQQRVQNVMKRARVENLVSKRQMKLVGFLNRIQKDWMTLCVIKERDEPTSLEYVIAKIRASESKSDNVHMCRFGYAQGKHYDCQDCDLLFYYERKDACERAIYCKRALERSVNDVYETMDVNEKKSRGAKKYDKIKNIQKRLPRATHAPYWNKEKYIKAGELMSVSQRAQRALEKFANKRIDAMMADVDRVTLEEAVHARFLIEPKVNKTGIFSRVTTEKDRKNCWKLYVDKYIYVRNKYGVNVNNLEKEYSKQYEYHTKTFKHHPEANDEQMKWVSTYECLMDLLSNALRITGEPLAAWDLMWSWIAENDRGCSVLKGKFGKLNPTGVLVFLAQVRARGISDDMCEEIVRDSKKFREIMQSVSVERVREMRNDLKLGLDIMTDDDWYNLMYLYIQETEHHINMIRGEMHKQRLPAQHDFDKLAPLSAIAYAWHWGNQYRFEKKIEGAEETMLKSTVGGAIADGVKTAMQDEQTKEGMSETISKAFQPYLEKMNSTIGDFAKMSSETMETVKKQFTEMGGKMTEQVTSLCSQFGLTANKFGGVADLLTGIVGKIGSFVPGCGKDEEPWLGLPTGWTDMVNVNEVISLIECYLIYIHCKNKLVRSLVVLVALHKLGILELGIKAMKWAFEKVKKMFHWETAGKDEEETWFDWLSKAFCDVNVGKAAWLSGLLVVLLCGVELKSNVLKTMGKKVMKMLTNLHYVGLGLLGGKRIFEYIGSVFSVVFDYIKDKIFGVVPKKNEVVGKIMKWSARVKFFITEEGIKLMRMSQKALDVAQSLYQEGVELLLQTQCDEAIAGRGPTALVARLQKDALTVHNVVYRVKNYTAFRPTMYHIQLVGAPGIGKSTLTSAIVKSMKDELFCEAPDHNLVYTLNDAEHFDGYAQQLFIIGDDLVRYNDAKHATQIIGLITNTPVLLPMAHLEDKGMFLDTEVMISSVNLAYPEYKDVLSQDAIRRRRHVLAWVNIDNEVMDESTHKFDFKKWTNKYAPGKTFEEQKEIMKNFPHLKFDFLKPVPDLMDPYEKEYEETRDENARFNNRYAEGDELPAGFTLPLVGLDYNKFVDKVCARYRAMRKEEKATLPEQKKQMMQRDWNEIDEAIDKLYDGEPPSKFLQGLYCPPEINLGTTKEQAKVADKVLADAPEVKQIKKTADEVFVEVDKKIDEMTQVPEQKPWTELTDEDLDKMVDKMVEERTVEDAEETMLSTVYGTAQEDSEDDEEYTSYDKYRIERMKKVARTPGPTPVTPILYREHAGKQYIVVTNNGMTMTPAYNMKLDDKGVKAQRAAVHFWSQHIKVNGIAEAIAAKKIEMEPNEHMDARAVESARGLTIQFVNRLRRVNNDWCYSLDFLEGAKFASDGIWSSIPEDEQSLYMLLLEERKIKFEHALFYKAGAEIRVISLAEAAFADACLAEQMRIFLDRLTAKEQDYLVQHHEGFWRMMGKRFWKKIDSPQLETWCNNTMKQLRNFGRWFWDTFIADFRWVISLAVALVAVQLIIEIGLLFMEPVFNETSKVLHRGRGQRPVINGKWTDSSDMNFQQQCESLWSRNLAHLEIDEGRFSGVKSGQYIYTVWHPFRNVKDKIMLRFQPTPNRPTMWEVEIKKENIIQFENSDLAVIYAPEMPAARNVDSWFLTDNEMKNIQVQEVVHQYYGTDGTPRVVSKKPMVLEPSLRVHTYDGKEYVRNWMLQMDSSAVAGSSGGPILLTASQLGCRRIAGLQSLCKEPWSWAQGVTQEMIEKCKSQMTYKRAPIEEMGPLVCDETMGPVRASCITEHLDVAGGVPKEWRAGAYGESKIVKTPLFEHFGSARVPAVMQPSHEVARGREHPLQHSVNKFGRDEMKWLPTELVQQAVTDVSNYIAHQLEYPNLTELTLEEIVLGTDHDGSAPMNLKTSPGLPYVKQQDGVRGKKKWVRVNEEGEIEHLSDELIDDVLEWDEHLRNGKILPCSMYEFAKDELRPKNKAHGIGGPIKTRSISVMNMAMMMLFRKYHLDLTAHMHVAANGKFQSCIGINPEGPEWMALYDGLVRKSRGEWCMDLDVGNWDGHFTPQLFFAVVQIVNNVYKDAETSEAATARYAIAHAALFGYDQFDDVVFKKLRGMPSGFGGTALYNTVGHMVVFYVWWLMLARENGFEELMNWNMYLNCVCVRFYGDDVVASVDASVCEWFNPTAIAAKYSEYGWPTTTAEKDGRTHSWKTVMEVSFLKRKFVLDDNTLCVFGALDIEVIHDLFVWMRQNSKTVSRVQMLENVHNAFQYLFAYGRDVYEKYFVRVNKLLSMYGFEGYFVTYDVMYRCIEKEFGIIPLQV